MELSYHITSHLVYTGKTIFKNGIVTLTKNGKILHVGSAKLTHSESARTQFKSGLVLPAPYPNPAAAITLKEIIEKRIDPLTFDTIDTSGMVFPAMINSIVSLQKTYELYGNAFLTFWNAISVNEAKLNGINLCIEPDAFVTLLNIQGINLKSFKLADNTIFKPVVL